MSSGSYRFIGTCIRRSFKNVEDAVSSNARLYHTIQLASNHANAQRKVTMQHLSPYNNNLLNTSSFQQSVSFSDKTEDSKPTEDDATTATPPSEEETKSESGPESEPTLSKEEELETQVKELKDQLLRSLAEQENIRRIAQRDVENSRSYAISSFAKSLLETSDNLSRAMDAVPEEYRNDNENHAVLATLYQGISMTDNGLTKAFEKNGLKKYGDVGDVFDPNLHEALYEYVDESKEVGTVGQVMKKGFMLKDRVIRPADVGVIKKA